MTAAPRGGRASTHRPHQRKRLRVHVRQRSINCADGPDDVVMST